MPVVKYRAILLFVDSLVLLCKPILACFASFCARGVRQAKSLIKPYG